MTFTQVSNLKFTQVTYCKILNYLKLKTHWILLKKIDRVGVISTSAPYPDFGSFVSILKLRLS